MLSDNIREYRKRNNMSQDELAEKLGVSRQSVSLWETGQTQPTLDNIIALAKIFNISTDAILGNNVEDKKQQEEPQPDENRPKTKKTVIFASVAAGVIICAALLILLIVKLSQPKGNENDTESVSTLKTDTKTTDVSETFDEGSKDELTDNIVGQSETAANTVKESETETEVENEIEIEDTTPEPETETEIESTAETKAPETTETEPVMTQAKTTDEITSAAETKESAVEFDLYAYLKNFVLNNGTVSGTYCAYRQPSKLYGGYENEYFDVIYWSDYEKIELSLWCPLDDTLSITFILTMRGKQESTYEYSVSKYYRNTGDSLRLVKGRIDPSVFSDSYPLKYETYQGSNDGMDSFLEESRVGMVDLIRLIKIFVYVENLDFDFSVFGFKNF